MASFLLFHPVLDQAATAVARIEANADALVALPPHHRVQLQSPPRRQGEGNFHRLRHLEAAGIRQRHAAGADFLRAGDHDLIAIVNLNFHGDGHAGIVAVGRAKASPRPEFISCEPLPRTQKAAGPEESDRLDGVQTVATTLSCNNASVWIPFEAARGRRHNRLSW